MKLTWQISGNFLEQGARKTYTYFFPEQECDLVTVLV